MPEIKTKKKDKTRESIREFIISFLAFTPPQYDFYKKFDEKIPEYLIKQGRSEDAALILTRACVAYEKSSMDKENYDHCLGICNKFEKRGYSQVKSAFLTTFFLERNDLDSLEAAEKEFSKLEKQIKEYLNKNP